MMKIIEINVSKRDGFIKFESEDIFLLDDLVYIKTDSKNYYYSVISIFVSEKNPDTYIITAKPSGYYCMLEKEQNGIKQFLLCPVIKETDPETIKRIREESCYL